MSNLLKTAETRNSKTCEWIGDGNRCKTDSTKGRNYCTDHLFKVYAEGTAQKPRTKRIKKRTDVDTVIGDLQELYQEMLIEGEF